MLSEFTPTTPIRPVPITGTGTGTDTGTWPWDSGSHRPFAKLAESTLNQLAVCEQRCGASDAEPMMESSGQAMDHVVTSSNGKFHLWAKQVRIHHAHEHTMTCRMVLIQGQKNEILNTWIFPTAPERCPVFAAELIAMAGMPRLTFIDIQNPAMIAGVRVAGDLSNQLRSRHAGLVCDELPPSWAIDATLGGYIFSRSLDASAFPSIDACYEDYLGCYLRSFMPHGSSVELDESATRSAAEGALHRYRLHHMQHSPGTVFLGKLFGDDWTNDFLLNFLFTSA